MSRSSTLPAHGTPVFEPSPDYRTLLEEHWRRQVATITELSFAALTPGPHDQDDPLMQAHRLQVAARLIATARQHLQETEAALAAIRDDRHGRCGACGAPVTGTRADRALGNAMRRLPASALPAAVAEEQP